jgi:hypothetical protein
MEWQQAISWLKPHQPLHGMVASQSPTLTSHETNKTSSTKSATTMAATN